MDRARKAILEQLAELLARAWPEPANRVRLERDLFPHNRDEAYLVQDGMHRLLDAAVAGWKVGATSQKMRELDGHEEVLDVQPEREVPRVVVDAHLVPEDRVHA